MGNWINIPELQLLVVIFVGFMWGWLASPRLLRKPFLFLFLSGILFFGVRFVPAFAQLDTTATGLVPGNGIVAAGIMWIIYSFCMLGGYLSAKRLWPTIE